MIRSRPPATPGGGFPERRPHVELIGAFVTGGLVALAGYTVGLLLSGWRSRNGR